jgi:hypothetical protein
MSDNPNLNQTTKSSGKLNKYQPTKILNKKGLLNEAAIKCRYDLMYINDYYRTEGEKLKDDNLFLRNRSECDRDIINFKKMIVYDSNDELMYRAGYIKNKILNSQILDKLDNLDHTETSKTREIVMKAKKEYTSRVTEALTNDSVSYKEFKLKERRENIEKNKIGLSLVKQMDREKLLNLSMQRERSESKKFIEDRSVSSHGGGGSDYYNNSPYSPKSNFSKKNKNSNSPKKRMLNYGKVPKPRKKSRIIKEGTFTDHIEGYQNINSNSSNLLEYINNDINLFNGTNNNGSFSLPDINKNKTPKNTQNTQNTKNTQNTQNTQNNRQEEYTNVSLEGNKIYLMKNYLYTPEEKEARMLKVTSMNTVLNNSQIRNVLKKRNSKKLVHEILTGITGGLATVTGTATVNSSNNNFGLKLKTEDGNISTTFDNYNNSYSEYGKSMMNKLQLHLLTNEDTVTLSHEKNNSNQNTNQSHKRSNGTIKMNGRDILKKIYTGGPMTNDTDSKNKKSDKKISLTFNSRNTLGRQSGRLPSYLIQAKNNSSLKDESSPRMETSMNLNYNLHTEPHVANFKTYSHNEEKLNTEPNKNQNKRRITFEN